MFLQIKRDMILILLISASINTPSHFKPSLLYFIKNHVDTVICKCNSLHFTYFIFLLRNHLEDITTADVS